MIHINKKKEKMIKDEFELSNGAKSVPLSRKLFKFSENQFFYLGVGDQVCRIGIQKLTPSFAHIFVEASKEIKLSGASENNPSQIIRLKEKLQIKDMEIASLEAELVALERGNG